jgi:hypothetical protein
MLQRQFEVVAELNKTEQALQDATERFAARGPGFVAGRDAVTEFVRQTAQGAANDSKKNRGGNESFAWFRMQNDCAQSERTDLLLEWLRRALSTLDAALVVEHFGSEMLVSGVKRPRVVTPRGEKPSAKERKARKRSLLEARKELCAFFLLAVRYQQKLEFVKSGGDEGTTDLVRTVVKRVTMPLKSIYDASHAGKLLKCVIDTMDECARAAGDYHKGFDDPEIRALDSATVGKIDSACQSMETGMLAYFRGILASEGSVEIFQDFLDWAVRSQALLEPEGTNSDTANESPYDIDVLLLLDSLSAGDRNDVVIELRALADHRERRRKALDAIVGTDSKPDEGGENDRDAAEAAIKKSLRAQPAPPVPRTLELLLEPFQRVCARKLGVS